MAYVCVCACVCVCVCMHVCECMRMYVFACMWYLVCVQSPCACVCTVSRCGVDVCVRVHLCGRVQGSVWGAWGEEGYALVSEFGVPSNLNIVVVRGQSLGICRGNVDVAPHEAPKVGLEVTQYPPQDVLHVFDTRRVTKVRLLN